MTKWLQREGIPAKRVGLTNNGRMNFLPLVAIFLLIIWVVARLVLAVTGFFLHLLWIGAVLLFLFWLIRKILK